MRYFLARREPRLTRFLMIESGSRKAVSRIPEHMTRHFQTDVEIDLLTCYDGLPPNFSRDTIVFNVTDYPTADRRAELVDILKRRNYSAAGIVCSGEPIMAKWKWMLAARLPAKLLIVNENGDYFWIHRDNWNNLWRLGLSRLGLAGEGSAKTLGRVLVFPFALVGLVAYALWMHARRRLRLAFR